MTTMALPAYSIRSIRSTISALIGGFVVLKRVRVRLWLIALMSSLGGGCVVFPEAMKGSSTGPMDVVAIGATLITAIIGLLNSWIQRKEKRDRSEMEAWMESWTKGAEDRFDPKGAARENASDAVMLVDARQARLEVRMANLENEIGAELREVKKNMADSFGIFSGQLYDVTQTLRKLADAVVITPRRNDQQAL